MIRPSHVVPRREGRERARHLHVPWVEVQRAHDCGGVGSVGVACQVRQDESADLRPRNLSTAAEGCSSQLRSKPHACDWLIERESERQADVSACGVLVKDTAELRPVQILLRITSQEMIESLRMSFRSNHSASFYSSTLEDNGQQRDENYYFSSDPTDLRVQTSKRIT